MRYRRGGGRCEVRGMRCEVRGGRWEVRGERDEVRGERQRDEQRSMGEVRAES